MTPTANEKLPRHLGLFGLWLLVVNGLIGAGIFGLPGGYTIPALGIVACIWLAFQVKLASVIATALFILLGTALYLLARFQRNRTLPDE